MKDLVWDQRMLGEFRALAILTEEEDLVLDDWARGRSVAATSMTHHMSTRKVDYIRHALREKYDRVKPYAQDLPERRTR